MNVQTDRVPTDTRAIIRSCVHCGFCTATCPTYLVTGDELDSPRGRIWLMKDMLGSGAPPSPRQVRHIDRCLTCLGCTTTCPSGVDYRHLADAARAHIEHNYRRPLGERLLRGLLPAVMTRRRLFRTGLRLGRLGTAVAGVLPGRLRALLDHVPAAVPPAGRAEAGGVFKASGERRGRVALHLGCVQPVLRPGIDDAAIRLLGRHGIEVVVTRAAACCGALDLHLGREQRAATLARANIAGWDALDGIDAIVSTASGCGSTLKDYGALAGAAPRVPVMDISEYLATLPPLPTVVADLPVVAWQSPCSLTHGQRRAADPPALLRAAGFTVREPAEAHICCGSAGTYSILQPDLSSRLKARKQGHLAATGAAIVASANIGCMEHLASAAMSTLHVVELLDWASGGPAPAGVAVRG